MKNAPILLLLSAALVAGCTGSTDPTTATVFDNFRNIESGEYDRQIAANEVRAAQIARSNEARRGEIASLGQQRSTNAAVISELRREIAVARGEAAAARRALQGQPDKLSRLSSLESQIDAVEASAATGAASSATRRELQNIRSAIRALSS